MNILIIGNISVGKSTLLQNLKFKLPDIVVKQEPVGKWMKYPDAQDGDVDLMTKSRELNKQFMLQVAIAQTFFDLGQIHSGKLCIQEQNIYSGAKIFVPALKEMFPSCMCSEEILVLETLIHSLCLAKPQLITFDVLIYLKAGGMCMLDRIKNRGRKQEENIDLEFLELLDKQYNVWKNNLFSPIKFNRFFEFDTSSLTADGLAEKVIEVIQ